MDLKSRLQRMLQIVEDAERVGALADIERDIVLSELREAYTELKYSAQTEVVAPVADEPIVDESEADEPEVEVELIFEEEEPAEDEPTEEEVVAPAIEEPTVEEEPTREIAEEEPAVADAKPFVEAIAASAVAESIAAAVAVTVATEPAPIKPAIEPIEEPVAEPAVEKPAIEPIEEPAPVESATPSLADELNSLLGGSTSSEPKSAILSLYDDEPTPVLGEQFREITSVADAISAPKGVAEVAPVLSLRSAIGVADKFMLVRELFAGDVEAYEEAVDALEAQPSFDDCIIYISEHYTWSPNAESTKLMMELLNRKYN